MNVTKGFAIEITSGFEGWWRYNVAVMCGCFDASGQRTGFASAEDRIADIGCDMQKKPAGYDDGRKIEMTTPECDNLVLYIYIVPHTLPSARKVEEYAPFDIEIRISYDGKPLPPKNVAVNQWSGTSLEMKVKRN